MTRKIVLWFAVGAMLGVGVSQYVVAPMLFTKKVEVMQDATQPMSFFVTSNNPGKGGDLGGLAGADLHCTTLAAAVGAGDKTWRAYLSTVGDELNAPIHARERIGDGPWYNAAGVLVAKNVEELHTQNTISKQSALTEKGTVVNGRGDTPNVHDILTGSTEGGYASTTAVSDTTCADWTSGNAGSAIVGHHDRIGRDDSAPMKSWNESHLTRGCSLEALKTTGGGGLFYCFAE